jgi:hypothetical protein
MSQGWVGLTGRRHATKEFNTHTSHGCSVTSRHILGPPTTSAMLEVRTKKKEESCSKMLQKVCNFCPSQSRKHGGNCSCRTSGGPAGAGCSAVHGADCSYGEVYALAGRPHGVTCAPGSSLLARCVCHTLVTCTGTQATHWEHGCWRVCMMWTGWLAVLRRLWPGTAQRPNSERGTVLVALHPDSNALSRVGAFGQMAWPCCAADMNAECSSAHSSAVQLPSRVPHSMSL